MASAAIASSPAGGLPQVQVNRSAVDLAKAFEVVLGYAFEEVDLGWSPEPLSVGPPITGRVPRRGYRTYDCVAAGDGSAITDIDILVPNAINAQMGGSVIARLRTVSAELSTQIAAIDEEGRSFWEFDASEVRVPPTEGDDSWPLWRAWSIVDAVPGSGIAVTHKLLHHKRPSVFPLLDNVTYRELGSPPHPWYRIHEDLTATDGAWKELEKDFEREAALRGGIALPRLRLHDILLWTQAVDQWDASQAAGAELLNR